MAGVGRSYDTVSFLSDYGNADEFVGVVKAVIRDLARHVTVLDVTHEVPPHDVRSGSPTLVLILLALFIAGVLQLFILR